MRPAASGLECLHAVILAGVLLSGAACESPELSEARPQHSSTAPVGAIFRSLPESIDPAAHYLVYLHNQFWETAAPGAEHPRFGPYQYEGILEAFAERRLTVIAERREPDADPAVWADRVVRQVRQLIAAGAPPDKITVVGFSKGGAIAILASSGLANDGVNFVVLAGCGRWLELRPDLVPRGRMLSIYEASDDLAGSCRALLERAVPGSEMRELEVHLGGGHGAFFVPQEGWIEPAVAWAHGG